jgi:hypothetical protein
MWGLVGGPTQHFSNVPFTMDNSPTMPPAAVNVLTKLQDFQSIAAFQTQMQVFVLPWLIHPSS